MDDIFEYPDDVVMAQRTIPAERNERKIIIKYAQNQNQTKPKQQFYYDKRTFDYNIMFMHIGNSVVHHERAYISFGKDSTNQIENVQGRHRQRQRQNKQSIKKPQQASFSIDQQDDNKSNDHKDDCSLSNVLDYLNDEENKLRLQSSKQAQLKPQNKSQLKNNKILEEFAHENQQSMNRQASSIIRKQEMRQNENSKQINQNYLSQQLSYNENNDSIKQQKQSSKGFNLNVNQQQKYIESSQIENFSYEFNNASMMPKNNTEIQHSKLQQKTLNQVHNNRKQEKNELELDKILNQLDEIDSDEKEKQINISEQSQIQRQNKIAQLDKQPFKLLYYQVKTENVRKINIRSMIYFDSSILKLKPQPILPYLKIESKKINITSFEASTRWLIGQSKIQLSPCSIYITCHSCNCKFKGVIKDGQCLAICGSKDCMKQALVQISKIWLQ